MYLKAIIEFFLGHLMNITVEICCWTETESRGLMSIDTSAVSSGQDEYLQTKASTLPGYSYFVQAVVFLFPQCNHCLPNDSNSNSESESSMHFA